MNADLENLYTLLVDEPAKFFLSIVHDGVTIPLHLWRPSDPRIGLRRYLRAMIGDRYRGDVHALQARLFPDENATFGGCTYVLFGPARAALLKAAETDADLQAALAGSKMDVFEQNLYATLRATIAAESEKWTTEAKEAEKEANAKLESAKELREQKRKFDEAFAATPETGVFVERPPKVPRLDDKEEAEKSASVSEPEFDDDDDDDDEEEESGPA
jgi:hypothetical protein